MACAKKISQEMSKILYFVLKALSTLDRSGLVFGLPWWLSSKESTCNSGDTGSFPGSGRSPGGGHCNPLQYSCLENPMDRGAWQSTVHRVIKSRT